MWPLYLLHGLYCRQLNPFLTFVVWLQQTCFGFRGFISSAVVWFNSDAALTVNHVSWHFLLNNIECTIFFSKLVTFLTPRFGFCLRHLQGVIGFFFATCQNETSNYFLLRSHFWHINTFHCQFGCLLWCVCVCVCVCVGCLLWCVC